MNNFFKRILDILYPKGLVCMSCEEELFDNERESCLCEECAEKMRKAEGDTFVLDGVKALSCFQYEDIARKLVLSYKDSNKPYISEYIAKSIAEKYSENNYNFDGIVFVPSNKKKLRMRGYDAMNFVANHLSEILSIPILSGLKKKEGGRDLTEIDINERENYVKNTFFIDDGIQLKGKNILLIDDIITTGATLRDCIRALKEVKVKKIGVITYCRALH